MHITLDELDDFCEADFVLFEDMDRCLSRRARLALAKLRRQQTKRKRAARARTGRRTVRRSH